MDELPSYFRYWGKADKDDPSKYHLLPYHCLDVAAIGWLMLDSKIPLCKRIARQLRIEPAWLRHLFTFCLAIHDIGKFARAFQGIRKDLIGALVAANPRMRYTVRHDTLGFGLWREILLKKLTPQFFEDPKIHFYLDQWIEIVTGHHGVPPEKSGNRIVDFFELDDEKAALNYVIDAFDLFLRNFDMASLFDSNLKNSLKPISWQLAGIAVLADWIGSSRDHFNYNSKEIALAEYWRNYALPSAQKAISALPPHPKTSLFEGIKNLFPFIQHPTPLQKYAITEPLGDRPQLFILEDVTGAGKTEAAMVLTHRLFAAGLADGLYVALPTMATANAMYQRVGKVYRQLYESTYSPSLVLAHGARELSDEFRTSVIIENDLKEDLNYTDAADEKEPELSATAYCNAWFADSRKKSLLADVGVGTLDQALLGVLPARHQSLRLLGLNRKVLLVDEVHAFDSYMQRLLDALLEIHSRQGGSAILLSATLPKRMRQKLIDAFHRGLKTAGPEPPVISNTAYPLATHFPAAGKGETHIDTRAEVKRKVVIHQIKDDDSAIEQIQQAVGKGKCVCWIRNTVKAARSTYQALADSQWMDKNRLHLFHSRFAGIDRQRIETDTLNRFGEASNHENRKGHVLIATQVVEQSLDLDFDVLITDLAPIDLLIQRAGRLCRHIRDERGNRLREPNAKDSRGTPVLYLFCPDPKEGVDVNWLKANQEGTTAVYPHIGQLWLSAKLLLEGRQEFTLPDDARRLVEGVYSEEAEKAIPPALLEASIEAMGRSQMQLSMANLNALKLNKGYTRSCGDWDEEVRIPTRLTEQETVSVALAYLSQGRLHPYAQADHHEWAMSVVKIPGWEWEKAKQYIPVTVRDQIEESKEQIKALHWLEVFPLTDETARYYNETDGWQGITGGNR